MKRLTVNGFAMPYVEIGEGQPIVCIHGSMNDFRAWGPVMGALSRNNRMIVPSLRHFFPDKCEGPPSTYSMAQHVDDTIAFIEGLNCGPVDLMGHSRGGHLSFRLAQRRPDLIRKLVLAEPGGALDESLQPAAAENDNEPPIGSPGHVQAAAAKIRAGDLEGGLQTFVDGVNGPGSWETLPNSERAMREDNAGTLLAQINEGRQPYSRADAESITVPTLFIVGTETKGILPVISNTLVQHVKGAEIAMIEGASHPMMRQQPKRFTEAVLGFLGR